MDHITRCPAEMRISSGDAPFTGILFIGHGENFGSIYTKRRQQGTRPPVDHDTGVHGPPTPTVAIETWHGRG